MNKQILYLIGLIAIGLYACTPTSEWDDMYDEQEQEQLEGFSKKSGKTPLSGSYTLTEEDYAKSSNEKVKKDKSFSDKRTPEKLVPEILDQLFYSEKSEDEVSVSFNYFGKVEEDKDNAYELTNDDYKLRCGQKSLKFDSEDDAKKYIVSFFNLTPAFSVKPSGSVQTIKYKLAKDESEKIEQYVKVDKYYRVSELEEKPDNIDYKLVEADYNYAGQKYTNFSNVEDAKVAIQRLAREGGKGEGNYAYNLDKEWDDKYIVLQKDDNDWTVIEKTRINTLLFKYTKDNKWEFVPPIKYVITAEATTMDDIVLTVEDYKLTGDGKHKNFDLRDFPTNEDILNKKLTPIIKTNYNIKLNDIVKVTFDVYTGSGKETRSIVLKAVEDK